MNYEEAMKLFSKEEQEAKLIRLYYSDYGWDPCVPILATTRARVVPYPSSNKFKVVQVIEAPHEREQTS